MRATVTDARSFAPVSWATVGGIDTAVVLSQGDSARTREAGDRHSVTEVIIGDGESFEAALRRFNKKIQQAGILAEARRREFYERPAAKRKRKEAKRRKR